MITEALDFKYLLLDNYKKLNIHENELVVILLIDHLMSQGNNFITADLLSLKMSLDIKEIDKILATLINRGLLEYISKDNKLSCSLNPLKIKLVKDFENYMAKEESSESNKEIKNKINNCVASIEKLFDKTLSPIEISKIKDWIMFGYHEETIVEAAKEAVSKNKKTIRNMDKILTVWQSRNDIETDGITTLSSSWDKSLEETIKIAKTPWLDQDEKDEK